MKSWHYSLMVLLLLPTLVMAEDRHTHDLLIKPTFRFEHQTIAFGGSYTDDELLRDDTTARDNLLFDTQSALHGRVNQYNATFAYPFGSRDFNVDLGVNIKFLNGNVRQDNLDSSTNINATIPMFYATALFNLPVSGMSASIGGSHVSYDRYNAFDYEAKLRFEWRNGFGMQGGWQHQQFSIDSGADLQTDFEAKGPFLDLFYRF